MTSLVPPPPEALAGGLGRDFRTVRPRLPRFFQRAGPLSSQYFNRNLGTSSQRDISRDEDISTGNDSGGEVDGIGGLNTTAPRETGRDESGPYGQVVASVGARFIAPARAGIAYLRL